MSSRLVVEQEENEDSVKLAIEFVAEERLLLERVRENWTTLFSED
jgi:hypothetical protein